ncbi:MAG: DUF1579 domain-containing protein [Planctomycetes bacterium]|nr:DUF1579 domain-containing protein [Planctomycetota bacterium]MBI3833335.1 DUF1579 domain-containing protein [Planctomycetota bacterium]
MNTTRKMLSVVLMAAAFAWTSAAFAQAKDEKKPAGDKPAAHPTDAKPAAPAADKKAAGDKPAGHDMGMKPEDMAKMMEMAKPGEYHAKLKPLAGKWIYTTKFRMTPEMPWEESTGKAEFKWILGGRYLVQEIKGNPGPGDAMMGGPFEGYAMTGYDTADKKYHNVWADNMGTGSMISTGTVDGSGKTFTYNGEYNCPIEGGPKAAKSIMKIEGDDKLKFEMYDKSKDGKEFMNVEVSYTREK